MSSGWDCTSLRKGCGGDIDVGPSILSTMCVCVCVCVCVCARVPSTLLMRSHTKVLACLCVDIIYRESEGREERIITVEGAQSPTVQPGLRRRRRAAA